MNINEEIDFVLCWVDGNDPKWQKEKNKYSPDPKSDNRSIRYRDWDNLQYWFRGVEKFTPWVNKIHFVTWGHLPSWLNVNHPKINVVKHDDFIPHEFLPTFSARPIETNLHRITGLSDKFVYFNDDMFVLKPLKKTDFFKNNMPCDHAVLDIPVMPDENHGSAIFNSVALVNKNFDKINSIKNNLFKWINPKYGTLILRTFLLAPWKLFSGFHSSHLPNAFLKQTFEEVWEKEFETLKLTGGHKFRSKLDVTQNIFKYWQLASGNFTPKRSLGKVYKIRADVSEVKKAIETQRHKLICLNDSENIEEFDETKSEIINSFEQILNEKSDFEL